MWGVIYVARSKNEADRIKQELEDIGIIAKIKEVLKGKNKNGLFEILVLEADVEEAYSVITSI